MLRRERENSTVLSIAIAQTHTEQTKSPIITALTIQCACQNSVNSERSEEVSGSTDCATSAGFMGTSFRIRSQWARPGPPFQRSAENRMFCESSRPLSVMDEFPAELGQKRARDRPR